MKTEVSNWLNSKFLKWQMRTGDRKTMSDFADYLGIKPTTLSNWLNQDIDPRGENVKLLAEKLGYEIYDILGLVRPDKRLRELQEKYDVTPEERKDDLLTLVEDWLEEIGGKRLP